MDAATEALAKTLSSTPDAKKHAEAIARFVDARIAELARKKPDDATP